MTKIIEEISFLLSTVSLFSFNNSKDCFSACLVNLDLPYTDRALIGYTRLKPPYNKPKSIIHFLFFNLEIS